MSSDSSSATSCTKSLKTEHFSLSSNMLKSAKLIDTDIEAQRIFSNETLDRSGNVGESNYNSYYLSISLFESMYFSVLVTGKSLSSGKQGTRLRSSKSSDSSSPLQSQKTPPALKSCHQSSNSEEADYNDVSSFTMTSRTFSTLAKTVTKVVESPAAATKASFDKNLQNQVDNYSALIAFYSMHITLVYFNF